MEFLEPLEGSISVTYGSCSSTTEAEHHHVISRSLGSSHDRLVWLIPEVVSSGGCISAWSTSGTLLGRSAEQRFSLRNRRRSLSKRGPFSIVMDNATGIDAWGAWFDGVELLKDTNITAVDAALAKSKDIAIVGAGMSGLMTYLCLTQAGFTNVSIIEAGQRLGGRVHTVYLSGGPFDYSYQEMGPMRFPNTITLGNATYNVSDHQLVFQLAAEMNKINGHDKNLSVDFIPWYQSNQNALYYHDGIKLANGLPPTLSQIVGNSSLQITKALDPSTQALQKAVNAALPGQDFYAKMAQNMFKAHRQFIGMSRDVKKDQRLNERC